MMDSEQFDQEIVRQISSCQRSLLMYLLGLLGSQEAAEDALQETNIVLWQKRREYQENTKFFAWACQIAYFKACNLRKQRRHKIPVFSELCMEDVSAELKAAIQSPSHLEGFLKECLKLLNDDDRELLDQRYADGANVQSVAANLKQSARTVYRNLERIHERLFSCIGDKIEDDGRTV